MNARMLRAVVKILRGRGLKRVAAPSPGSAQWHVASDIVADQQAGFRLRDLPATRAEFETHMFRVTSPTGEKGWISLEKTREGAEIGGVFGYGNDPNPLNLGVKGYRQVFRGIRSALGGGGGNVSFARIPNRFRKLGYKVRRHPGREEVNIR